MNKIFITGGAGFIGSNLVSKILQTYSDSEVTVFDNFKVGKLAFLKNCGPKSRLSIIKGDLHDVKLLGESMRGHQKVIHLAANASISLAESDPTQDTREGTELAQNVFETARLLDIRRIIYISGSGVYGITPDEFVNEDFSPMKPISTYGASKLACEALLSAYSYLYDMKSVIFRFANVVGPNQTHGVTYDFMRSLFVDKRTLKVLGDGSQSKTYVHVEDICNAILIADEKSDCTCDIFNVGNDTTISVSQIAELAVRSLGNQSTRIEYGASSRGWKGDVPKMKLDSSRIKALGWTPSGTSTDAIQMTLEALKFELESGLHG